MHFIAFLVNITYIGNNIYTFCLQGLAQVAKREDLWLRSHVRAPHHAKQILTFN